MVKEERLEKRQERVQPVRVRALEGNPRALTFTASTEQVARDGDIIEVGGWDTAEWERNPVFLWMHGMSRDQGDVPIGRGLGIRKVTGENPRLEIDVEFDVDEFADRIFGLFERGFLHATSVGFKPKAYRAVDDEERAGLGLGPYGVVWTKAELLEVSAVSVPADPGALMQNSATPEQRAELVIMRGFAREEDRPGWDALLEALPADVPEHDWSGLDAARFALSTEDVSDLTDAVRDLTDILRAGPLTERSEREPERSADASDFWGLETVLNRKLNGGHQ